MPNTGLASTSSAINICLYFYYIKQTYTITTSIHDCAWIRRVECRGPATRGPGMFLSPISLYNRIRMVNSLWTKVVNFKRFRCNQVTIYTDTDRVWMAGPIIWLIHLRWYHFCIGQASDGPSKMEIVTFGWTLRDRLLYWRGSTIMKCRESTTVLLAGSKESLKGQEDMTRNAMISYQLP